MKTMTPSLGWTWLFWGVAALGFAALLALNLPGQMSFDSVMQLYEGRFNHQVTFNPWIMSAILGLADRVVPGTGLFMTLNAALFFASLAALPLLGPGRVSPLAPLVLALALLTPQVVNYQGIVWKDVFFANLAIAGFVALALGLTAQGPARRWTGLAAAVALLALAGLVRQNGLVAGAMAAVAIGVVSGRSLGWRRGTLAGLAALATILALAFVLGAAVRPGASDLKANAVGLRVVRHYDLVGAVARDPAVNLDPMPPERQAVVRAEGPRLYTDERVDTLDYSATLTRALWQTPKAKLSAAWWGLVLHRPGLYASHRLAVFGQVFLTPKLDRCVPVEVGIDGPAKYRDALGLHEGTNKRDVFLSAYAKRFYQTPVFSHLAYAIAALALLAALAVRRRAADLAVMGLLLAGLGFAGSFLLISIACDYRYLYMLDLATLAGLVYWAVDPSGFRPKLSTDAR